MQSRWKQDPEVAQIIKHFDESKFAESPDPWSECGQSDLRVIAGELKKIRDSFEYCARNYFWIVNEVGEDALFSLWQPQEIILDKLYGLRDRGLSQKAMIIKARRIGCSTLVEGLVAWGAMFFPNTYALVCSVDEDHSAELFGIMQHIYDRMPWWLRPMLDKLKYREGLHFQNPDPDMRRFDPGINSVISVQHGHQLSGVGQGRRVSLCHVSEFCDYPEDRARDIIEGDLVPALMPGPKTIGVLESTPKGAGTYSEELWRANVEAAEEAEWLPIFIPWPMEKHRFLAPEAGWKPQEKELRMQERMSNDWVRCDNSECDEMRDRWFRGEDRAGTICPSCSQGALRMFVLSDAQMRWMQKERINREKRGADSVKLLRQEYGSNAEECWIVSGIQVFSDDCIDFVGDCVREPIAVGNLDANGRFHGVNWKTGKCFQEWCPEDHRFDPEHPLAIWEWPEPKEKDWQYVVGVDIAEGLGGRHDYSVAWVNRVGTAHCPDLHVATFRSNTIDPYSFAAPVNFLGRMYNDAMMSIEYNVYRTTADLVRINYQYPNLYRWKHADSVNRIESNQWHWLTQANSKPKLWQFAVRWLRAKQWIIRDKNFAFEMKRFKKEEEDSRSAGAARNFHDDVCIAAMIALFTSHELDWDESLVSSPAYAEEGLLKSKDWIMTCTRCQHQWPAENPESEFCCDQCGCRLLRGKRNIVEGLLAKGNYEEMGTPGEMPLDSGAEPIYDAL